MAIEMENGGGQNNKQYAQYATNGKANVSLVLGAIGTAGALGLLNGNGTGLFANNARAVDDCVVNYREYAADQMAMQRQYCDLAQRVSINETANAYQNKISEIQFANVDKRFETEQLINDLTLKLATCNVVKGKPMITEFGSTVRMNEGMLRTTPVGYAAPILDTFSDCGC